MMCVSDDTDEKNILRENSFKKTHKKILKLKWTLKMYLNGAKIHSLFPLSMKATKRQTVAAITAMKKRIREHSSSIVSNEQTKQLKIILFFREKRENYHEYEYWREYKKNPQCFFSCAAYIDSYAEKKIWENGSSL